jgi:hypothetical protein
VGEPILAPVGPDDSILPVAQPIVGADPEATTGILPKGADERMRQAFPRSQMADHPPIPVGEQGIVLGPDPQDTVAALQESADWARQGASAEIGDFEGASVVVNERTG